MLLWALVENVHGSVVDLFFLGGDRLEELLAGLKRMEESALEHQTLLLLMDIKPDATLRQVAANSMRQGKWEGGGADRRGKGSAEDIQNGREPGLHSRRFYEMSVHQVLAALGEDGKVLLLVERVDSCPKHLLLDADLVGLVAACGAVVVLFLHLFVSLSECVADLRHQ